MQFLDPLLDNGVGVNTPHALNLEVEPRGDRVVIKGFALLRGVFLFSVFALGPVATLADACASDGLGRGLPFRRSVDLIPQVHVVEFVVRIVLEAHGSTGRPLGMLLGNALFGYALDIEFLPLAQLADEGAEPIGVCNDGVANLGVRSVRSHQQVACVDFHDLVRSARGMQVEGHTASSTVLVAVAVARVRHLLEAAGVEGDQAQAVGDELVGQHRGVDVEVDQVNGDGGDFGLDDATQRVGEREIDVVELEIDVDGIGLEEMAEPTVSKASVVSAWLRNRHAGGHATDCLPRRSSPKGRWPRCPSSSCRTPSWRVALPSARCL